MSKSINEVTKGQIMDNLVTQLRNVKMVARIAGIQKMAVLLQLWVETEMETTHLGDEEREHLDKLKTEVDNLIGVCKWDVPLMETVIDHLHECCARLDNMAALRHPFHNDPWLSLVSQIMGGEQ